MSEYLGYGGAGVVSRDQTHSLFGQTMGYVAATAGSSRWAAIWP